MQVSFMALFFALLEKRSNMSHTLTGLCRICGDKLVPVHKKRAVYKCTEHRDDLHKAFDTDVGTDDPLIHPKSFCKPCYSVMKTAVKKKEMCVPYKHSVEVFYWTQHQETNCVVSVLNIFLL